MRTFRELLGMTALASLAALGLAPSPAQAQNATNSNPSGSSSAVFRAPRVDRTVGNSSFYGQASAYPMTSTPGTGPYSASLTTNPGGYLNPYASLVPGSAPPPTYADPFGGFVSGQADAFGSYGQYLVDEQRSYLIREHVRHLRVDTRRRMFDEYLYERRNAPTWEDDRERFLQLSVRRSLNDPPQNEIWSGKALNDLLAEVQKHPTRRLSGWQFQLDEDLLRRINVSAARSPGNIGLLKNEGKLDWPLALRRLKPRDRADELRRQINALLPEAVSQAVNGKVDPRSLKELGRATDALQALLTQNVSNLAPGPYADAKRFLVNLDEGVKVLQQPDAGLYFTRKYSARGQTVPDLVEYMTRTGLLFAPAVAGDETAYMALHRALVAYAYALRTPPASP